jgi:hypothetical protein
MLNGIKILFFFLSTSFVLSSVVFADEPPTGDGTRGGVQPLDWKPVPHAPLVVGDYPHQPWLAKPPEGDAVGNSITEIPAPRRVSAGLSTGVGGQAGGSQLGPQLWTIAEFREPAHFPWMNAWDDPTPRGEVVIYEGMRVEIYNDGRYTVRCDLESPRTVVTIRLQLRVTERLDFQDYDRGTITLPPIVIEPDLYGARHYASRTYHVERSGYSPVLRDLSARQPVNVRLSRSGRALFGSVPAGSMAGFAP